MDVNELNALKARVDADDPAAMFVYAEGVRQFDAVEADKYIVLAAQLGNANAAEKLGDKFFESGDSERAADYYRTGAKGGLSDCAVKLAVINLNINEYAALRELEELAESGIKSACVALAAYHKSRGNRKEHAFWRSLAK